VRRLLLLSGMVLAGVLAVAPGAQASSGAAAKCNGTTSGKTIKGDVVVPSGAACQLINSTVRGDVKVRGGGYFQLTHSIVRGDVTGKRSETIFIEEGSAVKGDVDTDHTSQVFLFDSSVSGSVTIERTDDKVNVCGMTVRKNIQIEHSGRDILVGDPLALDCAGNLVKRGNVEVEDNFTDVELVVRGNTIRQGGLDVKRNGGPSGKFVSSNVGGDRLACSGNSNPFTALGNTGWNKRSGQCA
jgi:hypothetical protein